MWRQRLQYQWPIQRANWRRAVLDRVDLPELELRESPWDYRVESTRLHLRANPPLPRYSYVTNIFDSRTIYIYDGRRRKTKKREVE